MSLACTYVHRCHEESHPRMASSKRIRTKKGALSREARLKASSCGLPCIRAQSAHAEQPFLVCGMVDCVGGSRCRWPTALEHGGGPSLRPDAVRLHGRRETRHKR